MSTEAYHRAMQAKQEEEMRAAKKKEDRAWALFAAAALQHTLTTDFTADEAAERAALIADKLVNEGRKRRRM